MLRMQVYSVGIPVIFMRLRLEISTKSTRREQINYKLKLYGKVISIF